MYVLLYTNRSTDLILLMTTGHKPLDSFPKYPLLYLLSTFYTFIFSGWKIVFT